MAFTPRLSRPASGNKFYITKSNGGYSTAIVGKCKATGKPDATCNALANCVGYAFGRVNEIANDTSMSILEPRNAENWVSIAKAQGLTVGTEPRLGAVMCWGKGVVGNGSDGAGHVAVVEVINADGSVVTSESGYGSNPFWTTTRKKGSGNWGQNSTYKFLGFIYPPYTNSAPTRTLKKGDSGDDVKWLQEQLTTHGYYVGKIDGNFGKQTLGALLGFQFENKLELDGVCGAKTKAKLGG